MKLFSIILASLFIVSCNKPDPNPELKDPIYSDLLMSAASVSQQLEVEKKTLEDNKKALSEVVLQSGQNKYAEKRIRESNNRISRLEQEKQYLELKIEAYRRAARKSYLQAFKKGEPWPDPKEWSAYQSEKKLLTAKKTWDVKARINDFKEKENKNGLGVESAGRH